MGVVKLRQIPLPRRRRHHPTGTGACSAPEFESHIGVANRDLRDANCRKNGWVVTEIVRRSESNPTPC